MNRIYRLVFNPCLGQVQVASELARPGAGGTRASAAVRLRPALLAAALALAASAHAASSLPTGFTVGSGTVSQATSTDGLTMTLTQTGSKALLNWSDFSIGSGYAVNFAQDSASALTLNVVTGGIPSEIYGNLTANGGVFLINPNGILFGNGAQVSVGSLVATTLALTDDDGNNNYTFTKSGGTTALVNYGTIQTSSGGSVTLLAPVMVNTGTIDASSIALLAANKAVLTYEPGLGVSASLQASVTDVGGAGSAINNSGTLSADSVTLRSIVQSGLLSTAINMGGTITASTLVANTSGSGALVSSANVDADYMVASTSGAFTQSSGKLVVDALDLNVAGAATLTAGENAISTLQGTVGAALTLSNTTALGQAYELTVGGTTMIDNGSADITLTNSGNAFSSQVNLAGGDVAVTSGSALSIGNLSAEGDVALSGSTLSLTSAIDTGSNALSLSATSGVLSPSVALSGGAVSLFGAGGISLGADVTASTLTLGSTNTNIVQASGTLDVDGSTTASAGSGDVVLNGSTNQFGGAVTTTGDDVTLSTSGALLLGDNDVGGAFSAYGGSSIAQASGTHLELDGTSDFSSNGNITLTNSGNVFGGAVDLDGAAITVSSAQALNVGSVTAAGDVALSGSTLSLTTALDVGAHALSLSASNGSLTVGNALSAGAVTLYGSDGVTLGGDISAQALAISSTNAGIVQTAGGLTVSAGTTIDAGSGAVSLGSVSNLFGDAVTLNGGALDVVASGTLTLGTVSGSSLVATASTIALDGDVTTSGGQTYDGSVDVAGSATLTSTLGGDLAFTGAIGGAGSLALTGAGAVDIDGDVDLQGSLDVDAGSFSAHAISLGGDLELDTTSAITQNGAYVVDGTTTIDAGGNAITLSNAGNQFGGDVSLSGGAVAIRNAGALSLASVDASSLDAGSSGALSTGTLDVAGNAVLDGAGVSLGGTDVGGTLAVTSSAGITQTAALDVDGSSSFIASGDISLANAGNHFGQAVTLTGADVSVASGSALSVASVSASGDVTLDAASLTSSGTISGQALDLTGSNGITLGGNVSAQSLALSSSNAAISQSAGSLTVAGTTTVDAGSGAVSLSQAGNTFGAAVALNGGALAIAADGTLALGSVTGSSLSATADTIALGSAISTSGGQSYVGEVSVDSAVALAGSTLNFSGGIDGSGSLALSSAGAVAIGGDVDLQGSLAVDADSFSAQAISLGGDLDLDTTSAITQNGAYVVDGTTTIDAGGNAITLSNAGNQFGGDVSLSGGAAAIRNAGALSLAAVDASSLDAGSSGALSTGTLDVAGNAVLDGAGVSLGGTDVGGTLAVTSSAGITQTAALDVDGSSSFIASGDIALNNAGNRFDGTVTVDGAAVTIAAATGLGLASVDADSLDASAGGALDLGSARIGGDASLSGAGIAFGSVTIGGDLQASSSAAISQRAALTVGGTSTLAANGAVILDQADNDFQGAVSVAGSQIALADANDLQIASASVGSAGIRGSITAASVQRSAATTTAASGGVSLVAGGSLDLEGAIDAGSGDLVLASNGGSLTTRAALSGGNVSLSGRDGLTLGSDVTASGTLALASEGAISQTGGVLTAATLTGSAGGSATLDGDNQIAALGDFSATSLSLGNARALDVTGTVDAGSTLLLDVRSGDLAIDGSLSADAVRLQAAGAISESGTGRVVASTLSGSAGGATMLGDASTFAANQVQTLGDFQSHGGFSMTNACTLTLASLNGSSFSVDAGTAAFFLKVDGGDLLQRGTTPVLAGRGTWWSSGHIGTADAPIYVVTSDTAQVVDFIGLPPAYFYALSRSGSPVFVGGAINLPTSALATRAQSGTLKRVAYVDMGALNAQYRPFGIVQPGIRLPADQQPACDAGDPDAGCAQ